MKRMTAMSAVLMFTIALIGLTSEKLRTFTQTRSPLQIVDRAIRRGELGAGAAQECDSSQASLSWWPEPMCLLVQTWSHPTG